MSVPGQGALGLVASQSCLICGRRPSDPHHLRFAQARARVEALYFVDVKSGNARLSTSQQSIKKAVETGAVKFGTTER